MANENGGKRNVSTGGSTDDRSLIAKRCSWEGRRRDSSFFSFFFSSLDLTRAQVRSSGL